MTSSYRSEATKTVKLEDDYDCGLSQDVVLHEQIDSLIAASQHAERPRLPRKIDRMGGAEAITASLLVEISRHTSDCLEIPFQ
eukprot:scaffold337946_cov18-Prasinocladus_malaysianus.AAC.1